MAMCALIGKPAAIVPPTMVCVSKRPFIFFSYVRVSGSTGWPAKWWSYVSGNILILSISAAAIDKESFSESTTSSAFTAVSLGVCSVVVFSSLTFAFSPELSGEADFVSCSAFERSTEVFAASVLGYRALRLFPLFSLSWFLFSSAGIFITLQLNGSFRVGFLFHLFTVMASASGSFSLIVFSTHCTTAER